MSHDAALLAVQFSIERLQRQAQELSKKQYPGDHIGPRLWLELVFGLLSTASQYIEDYSQGDNLDQKALVDVREASRLGNVAYQCLSLLRGAGVDELPYAVVLPLQRWFDKQNVLETTFFRAELVANYELMTIGKETFSGIRNPSLELQEAIDKISWPVRRVTVPSKAFSLLPHFAIVAHELGHALYHRVNWDTTEIDAAFSQQSSTSIDAINQALGSKSGGLEVVQKYKAVFFNWFEELAADAFAFYLTGPAIFFALSAFLQQLGGAGTSITHPSNTLRRRALFDQLNQGSFCDVFEEFTDMPLTEDFNSPLMGPTALKTDVFAQLRRSKIPIMESAIVSELHETMHLVLPVIYRRVHEYLKAVAEDMIYTSEHFHSDLSNHLEPLLSAIPPIECVDNGTHIPTEFPTILNVGWVALLTGLEDLKLRTNGKDSGAEKLEQLHDVLIKAVELSEARRSWGSIE